MTSLASWMSPSRIRSLLVGLVARAPARVQNKLLAAFLAIVLLLIVLGAVGVRVLAGANERTEELVTLQRKIAAYRQVQHDTASQLHDVASALVFSHEHTPPAGEPWKTLDTALRQLKQTGYDVTGCNLWPGTRWNCSSGSARSTAAIPIS